MGVNKFEYDGMVKFDLTEDTITADRLYSGFTAHDKAGNPIIGTLASAPIDPLVYDYNVGYIDNGTWKYENPTNTFTDIYEVTGGKSYVLMLGKTKGTRFRAMFTTTDVRTKTSDVKGTAIVNSNNPQSFANSPSYTAPSDGYILVAKDNVGNSGLKSYLFDNDATFL